MKNIGFIIIILATLVATGCKRNNQTESATASGLELTLPQRADGFIETKAAVSPVQDMWLIQLKGTAVLEAKYLTKDAFKYINNSLFVDLTFLEGVDMLYAVANTANSSLYTGITTKAAILAKQIPFVRTTSVTDEQQELPMAGSIATPTSTTLNRVKLTYMVSKMEITVKTDKIADGASFAANTIKVYRIPKVISLGGEVAPSPAAAEANFGDDYEVKSAGVSSSGVFYMAPNCRGTGSASDPRNKTKATAPSGQGDWCTYVDIIGKYKPTASAPEQTVIYKLWLGNNLTNSYTLNGGSYYKVSVSILNVDNIDARITVYDDSFDLSVLPPEGSGDEDSEFVKILPPANCYVVYPTESIYPQIRFNALKKPVAKYTRGNSTIANASGSNPASSTDASLSNNISYQSGDKLEVVWQTAINHASSGTKLIKSISLADNGIAIVEVNGAGNAVLAYKRGSTILWNYHIWATDSNPFVNHINTGSNVNGTAEGGTQARFMDRNLGALSASASKPSTANAYKYFGLLYQHGRPTPYPCQGNSTTSNTPTKMFNGSGTEVSLSYVSSSSLATVNAALQVPMTFYAQWFSVGGKSGWSWYSFSEASLWNDYGTNKSIYDPCPYGYRIPKNGSWSGWTSVSSWTGGAIDGGAIWNGTWWPASGRGHFEFGTSAEVGINGYYWSSTNSSENNSIHSSYHLYFNNAATLNVSNTIGHARNQSIRCVQEGY